VTERQTACSGAASGTPVLQADGLRKTFGGLTAVHDVSLGLRKGEVVGLIGPNGAGKSTLTNLLTGLYRPDSGTVRLEDRDVTSEGVASRARRGLMRTFQHVRTFHSLTVSASFQLMAEFPRARGANRQQVGDLLGELSESFDFRKHGSRRVGELPYGSQKILALVMLAGSLPLVALLDEPFAGIAEEQITQASSVIRTMAERGTAICLIEHDMTAVMSLCARIVVLDEGHVIFRGNPAEVQRDARVQRVYLGGAPDDPAVIAP
jgi:branched-chain amino acid transport system ATP-binding protein